VLNSYNIAFVSQICYSGAIATFWCAIFFLALNRILDSIPFKFRISRRLEAYLKFEFSKEINVKFDYILYWCIQNINEVYVSTSKKAHAYESFPCIGIHAAC
jgi:hypothetical protein